MNKRRRIKRSVLGKTCFFILLIVIIICVVNSFKKEKEPEIKPEEKIVYLNKIKNNIYNVNEDVEKLIIEYMDLYYKSISELEENDMMNLFNDYEQGYINQTALNLLIDTRKLYKYDMKMKDVKYDITYTSYKEEDGLYTVEFDEDSVVNFNFMKDIKSKASGIENKMVIKKINDSYKIISYEKVQDFYNMINKTYQKDDSKDNETIKKELDKMKNDFITEINDLIDSNIKKYTNYKEGKDKITLTCDNSYNRDKALNYALEYSRERNDEWTNYNELGGNCQNYASQVLYAGGIPMDTIGNIALQWKHYNSIVDTSNNEKGRSYSWTGTTNFYEYARYNDGYGLCAKTNVNLYYMEAGDIAQVGYNSSWGHTVVVIGNIKNEENEIIDLLINSNSIDLENYPLSAYTYPNRRFIKIIGWNN